MFPLWHNALSLEDYEEHRDVVYDVNWSICEELESTKRDDGCDCDNLVHKV